MLEELKRSYYIKCITHNWACVIHLIHYNHVRRGKTLDRLVPHAWGTSCPTYMGTVLSHMHGELLAPHTWGPSCPTCMGNFLPHIHGDRLVPHAWGTSCPTYMGTVLPHMHGELLAPHTWGPSCPTCMGNFLPHIHNMCHNTMYIKHGIFSPILYGMTCQLNNNIIACHKLISRFTPLYIELHSFYFWRMLDKSI